MLNGKHRSVSTHWPAALAGQRRVLLHVGLHKTGSTALQRFLANAAEELRVRGVLYPVSGRPANSEGHHNIAWQMGGDRRFRSFAGTLDDVASEIVPHRLGTGPDHRAVIAVPGCAARVRYTGLVTVTVYKIRVRTNNSL